MEINKLTERLLAEGFTKENKPDYVKPWNDYYGGFEYESTYQSKLVFKTRCGLLVKGSYWSSGTMYYMGVTWSPENGNPTIRCPYNKLDCQLNHPLLAHQRLFDWLVQCCCAEALEPYEYNKSIDKAFDDKAEEQRRLYEEFKAKKSGRICSEMCHFNEKTQQWEQNYNPIDICSKRGCSYCTILGRELSRKKGNVFYDVREVRADTAEGLLNVGDIITITKGKRFFEKNCSIDICKIIAQNFRADIEKKYEMRHHSDLFFLKHHGIKYEFEIINVRAEARESRDLEQDLADIAEGVQVIHESDFEKGLKQQKRERRAKAAYAKAEKLKMLMKKKGFNNLDVVEKIRIEKMIKQGLIESSEINEEPENQQLTFF